MYRYYSILRPVSVGTYPKPQGNTIIAIHNFDDRMFLPEIGRLVWGYIEYKLPVSKVLLEDFELVEGKL